MNILFVNTYDILGGAARVASDLKTQLQSLDHQVDYFVYRKDSSDPHTYQLPHSNARSLLAKTLATDIDLYPSDYLLSTPQFKQADVVHLHNLHGYYFSLSTLRKISLQKPVVWTFHDLWPVTPHCAHPYDQPLKDGFYQCRSLADYPAILWPNQKYLQDKKRSIYSQSSFHIVTPSLWLKQKIKPTLLGNKSTTLIHNGINLKLFSPLPKTTQRKKLNLPSKNIILFVAEGGLNNQFKNSSLFIKFATLLDPKRFHFLIIGGPRPASLNLSNFTFVPYLPTSKLNSYFSAANIFVSSSKAESFGLVFIEALASGLPIVSFNVGIIPEIIKHKQNGYIVRKEDPADFAKGVNFLSNLTSAQKQTLSRKNISIAHSFSLPTMTQKYIKLYQHLIDTFDSS